MVVVGFQLIRISAFPGTAERAESCRGLYSAEHGGDAYGTIGHSAPVKGHLYFDLVSIIVEPVQHHTHIHFPIRQI